MGLILLIQHQKNDRLFFARPSFLILVDTFVQVKPKKISST